MGTIKNAGAGRAGSAKNGDGAEPNFFSADPARPAPAFPIVPTDREPGTGYSCLWVLTIWPKNPEISV